MNIKHIVFIVLISILFFSCENKIEEINKFNVNEDLPDISINDFVSDYSTEGILQVNIKAKLALKYSFIEKPYFEFPKGIYITFMNADKESNSTLSANYAIYYEKTKFAKAEKNVILKNGEGTTLYTEQLFIDESKNKLYSIVPVKIVDKDGSEINGKGGFESNLSFSAYRFTDVSGIQNYQDEILEKDSQNRS